MIETCLMSLVLAAGDTTSWSLSLATAGEDVSWQSPTAVRTDAETYNTEFVLTSVSVVVSYLGIEFGPIDVTDQIPSLSFLGSADGPCPVDFGIVEVLEPPPPNPTTIGFDLHSTIDDTGIMDLDLSNVALGTATVEIPIFGEVTVQIEEFYADGQLSVTPDGSFCPADIDGDRLVGTNDLLALIAAWGSADPDADIDGDGTVNTSDILVLLGDWGACP